MRIWLGPSAYLPSIGGVEEVTRRLALGLRSDGHEVLVLTHRWPTGLPEHEVIDDIPVIRLNFTQARRNPRAWAEFTTGLLRVQRELGQLDPPDLVHIHCVAGQAGHLVRYCRQRRLPLVLTTHGETVMDERQVYARSALQRAVFRAASRHADALTACSRWTMERASELSPRYGNARVIPNGVEIAEFQGLPEVAEPNFVAYGRHVPQKGFAELLAAFGMVTEQVPDARLLLGGEGSLTLQLRSQAGPAVSFVGPLDREGVRRLLSRGRVVVVPSRVEPFGIVALEALAAGRRLVYTDVGGLQELGHERGWGAADADPSSLATAMLRALVEPARAPDQTTLAAEYSWETMIRSYLSIYRDLLARPAASAD